MESAMTDVLGQPVVPGDTVVISMTGYRNLVTAKVLKLTPKGIQARLRNTNYPEDSRWAYEDTYRSRGMFVKVAA